MEGASLYRIPTLEPIGGIARTRGFCETEPSIPNDINRLRRSHSSLTGSLSLII